MSDALPEAPEPVLSAPLHADIDIVNTEVKESQPPVQPVPSRDVEIPER